MKVLLANPFEYFAMSGAAKAHHGLLRALSRRGHQCRVVVPLAAMSTSAAEQERVIAELPRRGVRVVEVSNSKVVFFDGGVEVHALRGGVEALVAGFRLVLEAFAPDRVLLGNEIQRHALLEASLALAPAKTILIAHTISHLPFGPRSILPCADATDLFRAVPKILTVSEYARRYIESGLGRQVELIRFPSYGEGPFHELGTFDRGLITMINPCFYKGVTLFAALASRMPDVQFGAVAGWGTTEQERGFCNLPNITLMEPRYDMNEVLRDVRVLLVPSMMDETFGQVVIDAMARGIPVLASDNGGLPEAKLGVDHVLPVEPIQLQRDTGNTVRLGIPKQDTRPWEQALREMLSRREDYERLSRCSRERALAYLRALDAQDYACILQ